MSSYAETRYEKDPSVVYREIADEAILVPIRKNLADMESIYALNDVGAAVWGLLDGQRNVQEIESAILDEYEVTVSEAKQDVREFLTQLETLGMIRRA